MKHHKIVASSYENVVSELENFALDKPKSIIKSLFGIKKDNAYVLNIRYV